MTFAMPGLSSRYSPSLAFTSASTALFASLLRSLCFGWLSNFGFAIFTATTAVSPSRTSSPLGGSLRPLSRFSFWA